MINQEFIAMCDCKEIQSDWKPKLGDWYFYSSFALAKTIFENEDSKKIEERITLIDCEKSIPTLGRFMSIYIPSIEDLIEMCKNKIYSKSSMFSFPQQLVQVLSIFSGSWAKKMNNYANAKHNEYLNKQRKYTKQFDSITKLLLALYMKDKHNKLWNSDKKQWETVECQKKPSKTKSLKP